MRSRSKTTTPLATCWLPDQVEVTGEGVLDKAASITAVKEFEPAELTFSDWKFSSINKDTFIVTYTVSVKGKFRGQGVPDSVGPRAVQPGSIKAASGWRRIIRRVQLKPPMPPPAASKSPAPAESPTGATPVAATGPDPIANEKIVWDLFKAKNYDGFATLLAPTFIEVESDGVYDKAAASCH